LQHLIEDAKATKESAAEAEAEAAAEAAALGGGSDMSVVASLYGATVAMNQVHISSCSHCCIAALLHLTLVPMAFVFRW
jgi:hypothetical protein